jgi:hypothetical protein
MMLLATVKQQPLAAVERPDLTVECPDLTAEGAGQFAVRLDCFAGNPVSMNFLWLLNALGTS